MPTCRSAVIDGWCRFHDMSQDAPIRSGRFRLWASGTGCSLAAVSPTQ